MAVSAERNPNGGENNPRIPGVPAPLAPRRAQERQTASAAVGAERIDFVDVSDATVDPGADLPRERAMGRFHVRLPSGELKDGAAAFVEIWRVLTFWRPAAMVASLPGAMPALDLGYRLVSPFRPTVARLLKHVL